jgi:hypothetical protein
MKRLKGNHDRIGCSPFIGSFKVGALLDRKTKTPTLVYFSISNLSSGQKISKTPLFQYEEGDVCFGADSSKNSIPEITSDFFKLVYFTNGIIKNLEVFYK